MKEKQWRRNNEGETMKEETMKEKQWRRNNEGETIRRNNEE